MMRVVHVCNHKAQKAYGQAHYQAIASNEFLYDVFTFAWEHFTHGSPFDPEKGARTTWAYICVMKGFSCAYRRWFRGGRWESLEGIEARYGRMGHSGEEGAPTFGMHRTIEGVVRMGIERDEDIDAAVRREKALAVISRYIGTIRSAKRRRMIHLRFVEGMTYTDIARIMVCTRQNVQQGVDPVIAHLREMAEEGRLKI
ncbi:MAG: sigma-70 family RNA polymerase sigma factor [Candidatus Atribacteria bacterium]|nr:sigma-70 family RNA polymerase sigma factor [Candidatus Atribacteria bacterium]